MPKQPNSIASHAENYGVTTRTITDWKRHNAPLTDPAAMVGWWSQRNPGKRVPVGILKHAERSITPPPKRGRPSKKAKPDQLTGADGKAIEIGFDATHQRMLEEEARLYQRIRQYEDDGQAAHADALRPAWVKISEALGQADTRQIKNAIQRGELIARSKVEQEYATLLRIHPEVLMHGMKEMRTRMELDPMPKAAVWDGQVERLVNELFRALPKLLLEALANE